MVLGDDAGQFACYSASQLVTAKLVTRLIVFIIAFPL